jgi:glycosyltransferase involved in cell wall biosynthesis
VVQSVFDWAAPMPEGENHGRIANYFLVDRRIKRPSLSQRIYRRIRPLVYPRPPEDLFFLDRWSFAKRISEYIEGRRYSVGILAGIDCSETCIPILRQHCDRMVIDAIDGVYSHVSKLPPHGMLERRRQRNLRDWERGLAPKADAMIYISQRDVDTVFGQGLAEHLGHVHTVPNGIYQDDHSDDVGEVAGFSENDPVIGFLGNMAYGPNVRAYHRLERLIGEARNRLPDLKLLVIGKGVEGGSQSKGVYLTGFVESIWPYVNRADVFVFPMETGAGQQNKMLDVMLARKPIIATSVANAGIGAHNDLHFLERDTDEEIINAILAAFADPARLRAVGDAGHDFVIENFRWPKVADTFERIIFGRNPERSSEILS